MVSLYFLKVVDFPIILSYLGNSYYYILGSALLYLLGFSHFLLSEVDVCTFEEARLILVVIELFLRQVSLPVCPSRFYLQAICHDLE